MDYSIAAYCFLLAAGFIALAILPFLIGVRANREAVAAVATPAE